MSTKRCDLQGIRGVAIIFVLMFHLKPTLFRLGFVGVDMFFVLSGFLMASIIDRKSLSISNILDFYIRRFKRIIPLFFVLQSLFIAVGCFFLLIEPDREQMATDISWAMQFVSNMQAVFENGGYWDQISSYRFFVHAWSLGVEIQFYGLAPFILFYKPRNRLRKLALLMITALSSLVLQLVLIPKLAYSLLPARIWQFLLGAISFEAAQVGLIEIEEKEQIYEKITAAQEDATLAKITKTYKQDINISNIVVCLMTMLVVASPPTISEEAMRLFGSVITSYLIFLSVQSSRSILCSPYLVRFGDISYSLYLIHWPMIIATKYYLNIIDLSFTHVLVLMVSSSVLAYIVHVTVENYLCGCDLSLSIIISAFCYLFVYLSNPYYTTVSVNWIHSSGNADNSTGIDYRSLIAWNLQASKQVHFQLPCERDFEAESWTNFTEEPELRCKTTGNGTVSVLVLGNSIAYRAFSLIHSILNGRYSTLRLYSKSGSPPLSNKNPPFTRAARIVVDKMRPDIVFNIHMATEPQFIEPFVDPKNDRIFREFQENLDWYSERTKYFVIDLPYYRDDRRVAYEVAKRIQQGLPLDDLRVSKEEDWKQEQHHRARLLNLTCSNCIYNKVYEALFDGDFYYLHNRTSLKAYTSDGCHLTSAGLNLMKPYYERIIDELLAKL